jgi:hypothetical protein
MKTLALILCLLGSGCVTQQLSRNQMPQGYYQYQASDTPFDLFNDGIQVVPLVEDNGCRRMRVPGSESWQGKRWRTVCQ